MANTFTTADSNQISNEPAVLRFRKYGDTGSYTTSVFTNGLTFNVTPGVATQAFDDTGDVYDYINEETGEITFEYGQVYNLEYFATLGNGLYSITTTSAGAQGVDDQVIAAGWTDKSPITLNLTESGEYFEADGEPTVTSVTGSVAGVLTVNDDYTIVADVNSKSGYSIVLNTAGISGLVTTETITIVYNSPNVLGQTSMDVGGVVNYEPISGYIETQTRGGRAVRITFHRGFFNGNLNYAFAAENNAEAVLTSVTISLKSDTTKDGRIANITLL